MPTSSQEAQAITDIARAYLPPHQLAEMCRRLYREVGSQTDNESLRITLSMLYQLTTVAEGLAPRPTRSPSPYTSLWAYPWVLKLLVVFHLMIIVGNTAALCVIPFLTEWYVALPLCSLIIFVTANRGGTCPLTWAEDNYRKGFGLPPTRGFVGHYIIRPIRRQVWKSAT